MIGFLYKVAIVACVTMFIIVQATTLEERIQQLNEMTERRPVIRMNNAKFQKYIGSKSLPRNYSFVLMMTALSPKRGCHICRQANDEFLVAASSFRNSPLFELKRLYFGSVDYDEGSNIFNSLGIDSAPSFLYFNEMGNFKNPDELNIQRIGFEAEVISRWIAEKTGLNIKIVRPPNILLPIMFGVMGLLLAVILYMARNVLKAMFNRNVLALGAILIVLLMTSGQMWNHIRGAPLMQSGKSQNFIHGSSSGQYVVESYFIMLLYGGISAGMVLMTEGLRTNEKSDGKGKKLVTRIGFCMLLLLFSILLAVFRQKSYGYPYRLLF